ncbi:MAG: glycosyltransferase [Gammaproteobacteria bacterium]|jgi:hypothetical protein
MDSKAPIVVFTFNRPEHTRATLESLAQNAEFGQSRLYIYCDGARNDAEVSRVEETRRLAHEWPHPDKTVIERERNWGLAGSIIDGVTSVCNAHGSVIVLEDDMVISRYFLEYMNAALEKYRDDERVICIHGYSFPIDGLPETYFIKGANCQAWATWQRGWNLFEADARKLYQELGRKNLMNRFEFYGAYPYRRLLRDQINGRVDSWAVRWYASALIHDKLTLYPGRSLIQNIGWDGSGRHCDDYSGFATSASDTPIALADIEVAENKQAFEAWRRYFKSVRRQNLMRSMFSLRKIRRFVKHRLA